MCKLGLVSSLLVADAKRVLFPYPVTIRRGFLMTVGLAHIGEIRTSPAQPKVCFLLSLKDFLFEYWPSL